MTLEQHGLRRGCPRSHPSLASNYYRPRNSSAPAINPLESQKVTPQIQHNRPVLTPSKVEKFHRSRNQMSHGIRPRAPGKNLTRLSPRRNIFRATSNVDFSLCSCGAIGCWGTSPPIEQCVLEKAGQMEFLEDEGPKFEGTAGKNKMMAGKTLERSLEAQFEPRASRFSDTRV